MEEKTEHSQHKGIQVILSDNQPSSRVLLKNCVEQFPHIRQPTLVLLEYVRKLIKLAEDSEDTEIATEIWSLIIDRLLQLDTALVDLYDEESRLSFCRSEELSNSNYDTHDCSESEGNGKDNPIEAKLDQLVALILQYIGQKNDKIGVLPSEIGISTTVEVTRKDGVDSFIFKLLLEAFDEHILPTVGAHSIPFIWFYICSLSEENCTLMLEFLWEVLRSPAESPNEWRKAHNAAAFLCGFLARANYVDSELASSWIRRISNWCLEYVEQYSHCREGKRNSGSFKHGTFYAAVQALMFIFCYRHDEMKDLGGLLKSCQFDKLLHNRLDPLRHISQGVALCFRNMNKRFELNTSDGGEFVTNNRQARQAGPLTAITKRRRTTAVDLYFPFSFCSLKICSQLILPLMRRFSPPPVKLENISPADGSELIEDVFSEDGHIEGKGIDLGRGTIPVDEGYEEELMCMQSVSDYLTAGANQSQDEEMEA